MNDINNIMINLYILVVLTIIAIALAVIVTIMLEKRDKKK
ncbi:MAG: hypothetical protein ACD_83C00202G0004 [uncultured bacterium]|nr:MAG: hypothetical protein ACD_83C00202G0004 [uncultured bacterium]